MALVNRVQQAHGRRGYCRFGAFFETGNYTQLSGEKVLSTDDFSGDYSNTRFAVEKVRWSTSGVLAADIYFNSMPPGVEGIVVHITPEAMSGEYSFSDMPSGAFVDPNPLSPGDVVVDTRGGLPDDELSVEVWYKEKGKRNMVH